MSGRLSLVLERIETPIGEMAVIADREGNLRFTLWVEHDRNMERMLRRYCGEDGFTLDDAPEALAAAQALRRYFAGDLAAIDTVPVKTQGTAFQQEVWSELRRIPCGTTISYGELAKRIGRPAAVRAVGLANGANPVGVVVPCHRVIGANGKLTGYGGGMERKAWLLRHEARTLFS